MAKPTKDDAALLVELAHLNVSMTRIEGADDLMSSSFPKTIEAIRAKYPDENSPTWQSIRGHLYWGETVATLVRQELFSEELAQDWVWFRGYWGAVAPIALAWRKESGVPQMYENFEWLASRQS